MIDKNSNVSWAAFHASQAAQVRNETFQPRIVPVFTEASTLAMVKHCLTVILRAHSPWIKLMKP